MDFLFFLALILLLVIVATPIMVGLLHGKSDRILYDLKKLKQELAQTKQAIDQLQHLIPPIPSVTEAAKVTESKEEAVTTIAEQSAVTSSINTDKEIATTLSPTPDASIIIATPVVELPEEQSQILSDVTPTAAMATIEPNITTATQEPTNKADLSSVEPVTELETRYASAVAADDEISTESPINSRITRAVPQEDSLPLVNKPRMTAVKSSHTRNTQATAPQRQSKTTAATSPTTRKQSSFDGMAIITYLWHWFIKDNPLAKIGIVLLFLGLSYLLKYSIDNQVLPIELRLAGAMLFSLVLLGVGWYLRNKKTLYALILQGGGIGIFYLTTFAAFRLYDLLPQLLAFGLMLLICSSSVILAILQRALSLAVIASLGGYLTPILLSTGQGSHIALFSYYLLISLGILVISFRQSWRVLNLIGFIFTFGVAALWGTNNYQPDFYPECQLFLIINLLIYGILAVILSLRRAKQEQYQTIIDTLLLFGAPLSGFAMQYHITQDWAFGPAFSALGFGLFYLIGATIILRRWPSLGRSLTLYGLAIGAGFATLSIPLAFSAQWTSLAWLIEGLAITWVGLKQAQRRFAWLGSLIMLFGFIAIFFGDANTLLTDSAQAVWLTLSLVTLAAAGLWYYYRPAQSFWSTLSLTFAQISLLAFIWTTIIRLIGVNYAERELLINLAIVSGFVWLWREVGRRLNWQFVRNYSWLLWPYLGLALWGTFADSYYLWSSAGWGLIWLPALFSAILLLKYELPTLPVKTWLTGLPITLSWLVQLLIVHELFNWITYLPWGMEELRFAIVTVGVAIIVGSSYLLKSRITVLPTDYQAKFWLLHLLPAALFLLITLLIGLTLDGQMVNWVYIPILNPLDEAALFAWLMLALWCQRTLQLLKQIPKRDAMPLQKVSYIGLLAIAFLWGNAALLKLVSYYADINWNVLALWQSSIVQATFALAWTITALSLMLWATHKKQRSIWLGGATLLFIVVAKLLLIDSANTGGLARAIAFIGVAVLVLIVGYFSPLPPKAQVITTNKSKPTYHSEDDQTTYTKESL